MLRTFTLNDKNTDDFYCWIDRFLFKEEKQKATYGATIYPRPFYFVDLNQEIPSDWNGRIFNLKTAEHIKSDAEEPWKGIILNNRIESNFLFQVALAKSIFPFFLYKPSLVVLPLIIEKDENYNKKLSIHDSQELRSLGFYMLPSGLRMLKIFGKFKKLKEIKKFL